MSSAGEKHLTLANSFMQTKLCLKKNRFCESEKNEFLLKWYTTTLEILTWEQSFVKDMQIALKFLETNFFLEIFQTKYDLLRQNTDVQHDILENLDAIEKNGHQYRNLRFHQKKSFSKVVSFSVL